MTIIVLFHLSHYRHFKAYYLEYGCVHMRSYFTALVSYKRFVELMGCALLPLLVYTKKFRQGKCTGISFIDSTPLKACHNKRIHGHNVFKTCVARGKNASGWFYGFKLRLVINDKGEICSFCLTPGNIDDRNIDVIAQLCRALSGKRFGDRGYISQELFERLYEQNITLITRLRKHMKHKLMEMTDKLLLRKRAVIESVYDFLKNVLAGISAYSFLPHKPSIRGLGDVRALLVLA